MYHCDDATLPCSSLNSNNVATPINIDAGNYTAAAISADDGAYVSDNPAGPIETTDIK